MFEIRVPFGVELEFDSDRVGTSELRDALTRALQPFPEQSMSNRESTQAWTLKSDGSCGHEITSPILRTQVDLTMLGKIAKKIQASFENDIVTSRCGFHVHLDMGDITLNQMKALAETFKKLEPFLLRMVPTNRAENSYCYPTRDCSEVLPQGHSTAVNFCDLYHRGSMEVRYHSGTCSEKKIVGWISLLQGIIWKSKADGSPRQSIQELSDFWNWIGEPRNRIDRKTKTWIDARYQELRNHDPALHRRRYLEARRIRDSWESHILRQYHFHIRRNMNREERREHDQYILHTNENGGNFTVPESYIPIYLEAFPDRDRNGNVVSDRDHEPEPDREEGALISVEAPASELAAPPAG